MADISQNSGVWPIRRIRTSDLVEILFLIFWICGVTAGHVLFKHKGWNLPGHRTALWIMPLFLGTWYSKRRYSATLIGGISGLIVTMGLGISPDILKWIFGGAIAGLIASRAGIPEKNLRGFLKVAGIGLICGLATYLIKSFSITAGLGRFLGRWTEARHYLAITIYSLSGITGGVAAWLVFHQSKILSKTIRRMIDNSTIIKG